MNFSCLFSNVHEEALFYFIYFASSFDKNNMQLMCSVYCLILIEIISLEEWFYYIVFVHLFFSLL